MLTFTLLAISLVIASLLILVVPLLRDRETDSHDRHAQNIHFARERLDELEQQLQTAAISPADYEALKLEIEATLAEDIDLTGGNELTSGRTSGTSNAVLVTLICCLVPIAAAVTYFLTGTPQALVTPPTLATPANLPNSAQGAEISELVRALEERLKAEPEDVQGWTILARTYQQLGRYPEALLAYQSLRDLQPGNADVYAGLADASAAMAQGNMSGEPASYVAKALELNPQHPQSLWLAGLAELQQNNNSGAIEFWQQLMPLLEGFPEQQAELQRVMNQTLSVNRDDSQLDSSAPANTSPSGSLVEDTNKDVDNQEKLSPSLNITVQLADQFKSQIQPTDTVFVIARAKDGPPAPLAVKRVRVSDLPIELSLSSADAMMPQLSIDNFSDLEVIARVSKSGHPIAQAGDLQSAVIESSNTNKETIELTINTLVE